MNFYLIHNCMGSCHAHIQYWSQVSHIKFRNFLWPPEGGELTLKIVKYERSNSYNDFLIERDTNHFQSLPLSSREAATKFWFKCAKTLTSTVLIERKQILDGCVNDFLGPTFEAKSVNQVWYYNEQNTIILCSHSTGCYRWNT